MEMDRSNSATDPNFDTLPAIDVALEALTEFLNTTPNPNPGAMSGAVSAVDFAVEILQDARNSAMNTPSPNPATVFADPDTPISAADLAVLETVHTELTSNTAALKRMEERLKYEMKEMEKEEYDPTDTRGMHQWEESVDALAAMRIEGMINEEDPEVQSDPEYLDHLVQRVPMPPLIRLLRERFWGVFDFDYVTVNLPPVVGGDVESPPSSPQERRRRRLRRVDPHIAQEDRDYMERMEEPMLELMSEPMFEERMSEY